MENAIFTIEENRPIARDILQMRLAGPTGSLTAPGQFINIQLPGFYLRRPISVCRWGDGWLDIIYKVVGKGTKSLSCLGKGTQLDVLCGLGNGFDPQQANGKRPVLIGGGVGVPPLYGLAEKLCEQGHTPLVAMGFQTEADVFLKEEFEALGCKVFVATEDGSRGVKGYVTAILEEQAGSYDYYYACGPRAMLKSIWMLCGQKDVPGQLSFEERMGCGFGACMGCSCKTMFGSKRVCVDGPVFASKEVVFP